MKTRITFGLLALCAAGCGEVDPAYEQGDVATSEQALMHMEYVMFKNAANGQYLDVPGSATTSVQLQTYPVNGTDAQIWRAWDAGGGNWAFEPKLNSALALDVSGSNPAPKTPVQTWEWNGTNAQLWRLQDAGSGYVYVKSLIGTVMAVADPAASSRSAVWMNPLVGGNVQRWKVQKADYVTRELKVTLSVGRDDLRFGSEVYLRFDFNGTEPPVEELVNLKLDIPSHTSRVFRVRLPRFVDLCAIKSVTMRYVSGSSGPFETTDNVDLIGYQILNSKAPSGPKVIADEWFSFRFTGDSPSVVLPFPTTGLADCSR